MLDPPYQTDPDDSGPAPTARRAAVAGRDRQVPGRRPVSPHRPGGGLPGRPPGLAQGPGAQARAEPVEPDGRYEIIEEGKILAELEHPNLVRVYDLDFHDDRPYLVMEYIRGRNLDQLASEGALEAPPGRGAGGQGGRGGRLRAPARGSSTATSSPRTSWSTRRASRG